MRRSTISRRPAGGSRRSSCSGSSSAFPWRRDEGEHHGLVEATKRAFAIRDRVVTDPLNPDPRSGGHCQPAVLEAKPPSRGGARRPSAAGAAASATRSGWARSTRTGCRLLPPVPLLEFCSGCVLPSTGILWVGGGGSLSIPTQEPSGAGAQAVPCPRPALAAFDDGRVLSYGTMGGEAQPRSRRRSSAAARFGMGLAEAVDAPLVVRTGLARAGCQPQGGGPVRRGLLRACGRAAIRWRNWDSPISTRSAMPACW